MKAANDWAEADTDQKQAQAVGEGKKFVNHAKVWAKILNTSILGTKETVNIMTAQLQDVKGQLETQLQLLRDKLRALQNTLAVQKESLSKLTAAFWGTVAAMLLGKYSASPSLNLLWSRICTLTFTCVKAWPLGLLRLLPA